MVNVWSISIAVYICGPNARVAQLVEHDLAKVGVAGSSPVSRSGNASTPEAFSISGYRKEPRGFLMVLVPGAGLEPAQPLRTKGF